MLVIFRLGPPDHVNLFLPGVVDTVDNCPLKKFSRALDFSRSDHYVCICQGMPEYRQERGDVPARPHEGWAAPQAESQADCFGPEEGRLLKMGIR